MPDKESIAVRWLDTPPPAPDLGRADPPMVRCVAPPAGWTGAPAHAVSAAFATRSRALPAEQRVTSGPRHALRRPAMAARQAIALRRHCVFPTGSRRRVMRITKLTSSLGAAAALLLLAVAPARADEKGTLQIWINGDKAYNGLAKV